jgi:Uma2 family endonuclease
MSKVEEPQGEYRRIPKKVSLEMYLAMISDGTSRLEYHDGEIVDIKSATDAHGMICTNLTALLKKCTRENDCKLYAGDREVWVANCNKMYYPDLVTVCGEHQLKEMSENVKATINPSIVIEVLSNSTKNYDLTKKSKCYKKLSSLRQIVLVWQDEPFIMVKNKNSQGEWIEVDYSEEDEEVEIGHCKVKVKNIYEDVDFENKPERVSDTQKY